LQNAGKQPSFCSEFGVLTQTQKIDDGGDGRNPFGVVGSRWGALPSNSPRPRTGALRDALGARRLRRFSAEESGALATLEGFQVFRTLKRRKRRAPLTQGTMAFLVSTLLLVLTLPAIAASSDLSPTLTTWPMFRGGPALLGVSPVVLPKDLTLLWTLDFGL